MKFAKDANMTFNWPIGAAINKREEIMEPLCAMFEAWAKQKEERPAFHPDPVYLPNLIANLEQKHWPKLFKSFSMVI